VREIEFFTQKGVYTRRIMEGMGLIELQGEINALGKADALTAAARQGAGAAP